MKLSQQLAQRLAAKPEITPKEKCLQSLYDTISARMQDYREDEFVELRKCVWDKLYAIGQAHVARQQRDSVPPFQAFQAVAGVQQATTQAPQQGYQPPPTFRPFDPSFDEEIPTVKHEVI